MYAPLIWNQIFKKKFSNSDFHVSQAILLQNGLA